MIDWNSEEIHWLSNPYLSQSEKNRFEVAKRWAPSIPASIWVRSSGSTAANFTRWVCLSKSGFLKAAEAANQHLQSTESDVWLCALPEFHVGGLAIYARAFLSGARVVLMPSWLSREFLTVLKNEKVTLTSLVPSQVYDLVQLNEQAPQTLRAVIVGGDALDRSLYLKARELGWPLLPSYGMTELGSQVATAPLDSLKYMETPELKILPHVQGRVDSEQRLILSSSALFIGDLIVGDTDTPQWMQRPENQEFITQDRVQILNGHLKFLNRNSESVKVLGEWVSLANLRERWRELLMRQNLNLQSTVVLHISHPRKGSEIVVVGNLSSLRYLRSLVIEFNSQVEKYERVESLYFIQSFPITELGKIQFARIQALIERRD